jgi:hypothetical protein
MRSVRFHRLLHPVTAFGLWALTILFAFIQFQPKPGYFNGGATQFAEQQLYGWPRVMLDRTTTQSLSTTSFPLSTATTTHVLNEWNVFDVCVNMFVCILVIGSAVFCIERWFRRPNPWQYRFRDIATIALVGSLVFAFYDPVFQSWGLPTLWLIPHVSFDVGSMSIYVVIPFFVGAYFVVYSLGAMMIALFNKFTSFNKHGDNRHITSIGP